MSGEKSHHVYETYKNTVMPYVHHSCAKAADMAQATMCTYPHFRTGKCVLRCCVDCQCINIPD